MTEIIKSIDVDVAKQNTFKAIVAKQGDNQSRYLKVQLMNEGEALQVESGATVAINAERVDGESKAFAGSVNNDGTVTVPIAAWILEIEGQARCSITILVNEQRLTSTTFYITVERAEFYDGTIEEDDEIDLLLQLLTAAENEDDRIAAETARAAAESARANAETSRSSNETTRQSNEASRVAAETARATASAEATASANQAAQNANNAAQEAASALLAGGIIPMYDEDADKNYTYQIKIKDGYPVLVATEAATTE